MTIIEKIKQSVEAIGLSFEYGAYDDLNEIISEHDFDGGRLCYCTLITTGNVETDPNGGLHDAVQVGFFVVDKTEFDPCTLENEQIIDRCKRDVYRWLLSVKNSSAIKVETPNPPAQRVYDQFDDIVTGYGVQITVRDKQPFSKCDL